MESINPDFSIIVPVYNTVKELERCVNSVLKQSYRNFELILVDDGSTDGSEELCDLLATKDDRIICLHKKNGGVAQARNDGVNVSNGDYLLFLDSDDMWEDIKALNDIKHIIDNSTNVDVICFGVEICNEKNITEKIRCPKMIKDCANKEEVVCSLIYTNQYFSACYVKVLKRSYFIENNLFFKKDLLSEDIEWSARVLITCKNLKIYDSIFYKRIRRKEGSLTTTIDKKNIKDILFSIEQGIDYIKKNSENANMEQLYYEYWAYQYAMMLGFVPIMKGDLEYEKIIKRIQKLKWLLKYDHVKKVRYVRILVSIIGIKMAIGLLEKYYKVRGILYV